MGSFVDRRLDRITSQQQHRGAFTAMSEWYRLRIVPSCPPSKLLHMRGGYVQAGYMGFGWRDYWHRAYTVPDLTVDLADPAEIDTDIIFATANWYRFGVLCLSLPNVLEEPTAADWTFAFVETGDEFETAGEAEAWFNTDEFRDTEPWQGATGYPLCGLVLRNDGQVGVSGAILPVDVVNRGRSYIWPSDLRPRKVRI